MKERTKLEETLDKILKSKVDSVKIIRDLLITPENIAFMEKEPNLSECEIMKDNVSECPLCGSYNIDCTDEGIDEKTRMQNMECEDCKSSWELFWNYNGTYINNDNWNK